MPEAKKTNTHWKNNSGLKNPIASCEKKRHSTVLQNAWSQKTNTLIEKTILALTTL